MISHSSETVDWNTVGPSLLTLFKIYQFCCHWKHSRGICWWVKDGQKSSFCYIVTIYVTVNTMINRIKEAGIWNSSPGKWSCCLFQRTEHIESRARERQELDKLSKEPSIHRDISFVFFNPSSSDEFPDILISKSSPWLPTWTAAQKLHR